MKRRSFLKTAGLGALAGGAAVVGAPAVASSNPSIKWRLASSWPRSLEILFNGAVDMAEYVRQATNGQFQIDVYPAGEIIPAFQVFDAVSNGTIQAGSSAGYYYYGKNPSYCFQTIVPFGMNARQTTSWLLLGGGQALLDELFGQANIVARPVGNTGAQMGGWYRKEIKTLDDLKGLKMRTAGFTGEVLSRLGVVPQQIPGGDIYPSLEKGTLDAVEYVGPYDDEKQGFYKVAKYYYYPGFWEGSAVYNAYFNKNEYEKLPNHYKQIIEDACAHANAKALATYDAKNPAALRRLIANGAILKRFPEEIMQTAFDVSVKLYEEYSAKDPMFKKIADSYFGFRDEIIPWFNVIENTYTAFLSNAIRNQKK
ncbi:TRAP transporter substrate-binding protein [Basilea psittacipulmonis]|uniref:ABC transporter substrate-binding protein n=1 Tax=Basilea psittacipulmonis DSM 24701 TaxID=1072685 RepID=A0A077DIH2_9BURK|nr:TRAP transporter substrate-binding protein DctP [Basilea psittacipulmonis]AIL32973.1 ABC transporter substrate-binding protein [Basilea psittacipulmonis DSM 24701]